MSSDFDGGRGNATKCNLERAEFSNIWDWKEGLVEPHKSPSNTLVKCNHSIQYKEVQKRKMAQDLAKQTFETVQPMVSIHATISKPTLVHQQVWFYWHQAAVCFCHPLYQPPPLHDQTGAPSLHPTQSYQSWSRPNTCPCSHVCMQRPYHQHELPSVPSFSRQTLTSIQPALCIICRLKHPLLYTLSSHSRTCNQMLLVSMEPCQRNLPQKNEEL